MKKSIYMEQALVQAKSAAERGEVPVGAVLVDSRSKEVVAASGNRVIELCDPTAHAELLTIRAACQALGTERIASCDLYVTLEPCAMCATAAAFARIRRIIYAATDHKNGAIDNGARIFNQSTCHHRPEIISGISETAAKKQLREFFNAKR